MQLPLRQLLPGASAGLAGDRGLRQGLGQEVYARRGAESARKARSHAEPTEDGFFVQAFPVGVGWVGVGVGGGGVGRGAPFWSVLRHHLFWALIKKCGFSGGVTFIGEVWGNPVPDCLWFA